MVHKLLVLKCMCCVTCYDVNRLHEFDAYCQTNLSVADAADKSFVAICGN